MSAAAASTRPPSAVPRPHGTYARYVVDRCRCFPCRVASSHYATRLREAHRRDARWRVSYVPPTDEWLVRHSETGEIAARYPGPELAAAHETKQSLNAYENLVTEKDPLWADAGVVRQVKSHILRLSGRGIGREQITRLAGVGGGTLWYILTGRGPRGNPASPYRLKHATAVKILAVPLDARGAAAGATIDARETWRLIKELFAAGLTKTAISHALGRRRGGLQISRKRVKKATEDNVRALHDQVFRGRTPESARLRALCQCPEWRR